MMANWMKYVFHEMRVGVVLMVLHMYMIQQVVTDVNIALGQPAFMSSLWSNEYLASNGNDGNFDTFFHTNKSLPLWWAVDFGLKRQLVSWVRVTNRNAEQFAHRIQNFTIELTDYDPRNGHGLNDSNFHECASHNGQMQPGETINITCKDQLNTRGRYLFIYAITKDSPFHLTEVEVVSDIDVTMTHVTGYRNNYNVSAIVDGNNATCQQVTRPESDEAFRFIYEMPNVHDNLTVTAVLDGGDCIDFPATMVYTEGDGSAMRLYNNNPSFCDRLPGKCVFECDCSDIPCHFVNIVILSAPYQTRKLCEIFIT